MAKSSFHVRRSRHGRFNVTLVGDDGRINGNVVVENTLGQSLLEADIIAREKIRLLGELFRKTASEYGSVKKDISDLSYKNLIKSR